MREAAIGHRTLEGKSDELGCLVKKKLKGTILQSTVLWYVVYGTYLVTFYCMGTSIKSYVPT